MINQKQAHAIETAFYSDVIVSWAHFGIVFWLSPFHENTGSGSLAICCDPSDPDDKTSFEIYGVDLTDRELKLFAGDGFRFVFQVEASE